MFLGKPEAYLRPHEHGESAELNDHAGEEGTDVYVGKQLKSHVSKGAPCLLHYCLCFFNKTAPNSISLGVQICPSREAFALVSRSMPASRGGDREAGKRSACQHFCHLPQRWQGPQRTGEGTDIVSILLSAVGTSLLGNKRSLFCSEPAAGPGHLLPPCSG